jgi:hypothetical protein
MRIFAGIVVLMYLAGVLLVAGLELLISGHIYLWTLVGAVVLTTCLLCVIGIIFLFLWLDEKSESGML